MSDTNVPLEPGIWTKTSWVQIGYGIWVNQVLVSVGLAFGFSAVALPQLELPSSRIHPTTKHSAWIAGALTLMSPIGCLICGFLMDRLGRRAMMILCMVPISFGWLYTGFAKNPHDMILGRIVTGIGCGMAAAPPRAYGTEISLPSMRGVIGVLPSLAMAAGIFIQASLGSWLQWEKLCYVCGTYSLFLMFLNWLLPETPYYVLMHSNVDKARSTLKMFRAKDYKTDFEIAEMMEFKNVNRIRGLTLKESFLLLFKSASCKPFTIIIIYSMIGQLAGVTILMFYAVEMLQASKSSVNPFVGNILLAATRFCSCILMSILIYSIRRRTLALTSALGIGITCLLLGIYVSSFDGTSVIPQLLYMFYVLAGSIGYYSLPLLMLFELIPLQIRGLLGGITVSLVNLMVWASTTSFPFVKKALGFPATIVIMGIFSLIGWIYLFLFLPETNGLSLPEIEEYFNKKRRKLHRTSSQTRHRLTIAQIVHTAEESERKSQLDTQAVRLKSSVTFLINKHKKHTSDSSEDSRDSSVHNQDVKKKEPKPDDKPVDNTKKIEEEASGSSLKPDEKKSDDDKQDDTKESDKKSDDRKSDDEKPDDTKTKDSNQKESEKRG